MLTTVADTDDPHRGAGWSFYVSFLASTTVHLVLVAIGAWLFLETVEPPRDTAIDGGLKAPPVSRLQRRIERVSRPSISLEVSRSQSSNAGRFRAAGPLPAANIERPTQSAPLIVDDGTGIGSGVDWGETVDGISATAGAGDGSGGTGGSGPGFFKVKTEYKSVVFVVDCSTSMRKPHASQWKTRFRRLQVELVNAITRMKSDQKFFIIFFNDKAKPMPARRLQPAVPAVKRHYLRWMARQRPNGQTDPRRALAIALKLQPDAIFFLTDGVFGFGIRKQLMAVRQDRVAIHTFAFGNAKAETSMKAIAEANGGKYVFVP